MGLKDLKNELLTQPKVEQHYKELKPEFDVAKVLITLRQELGITQQELANKAGVGQSQLARLENGKHSPRFDTLVKIAASVGFRIKITLIQIQTKSYD